MDLGIKGRVALVSGASEGIGRGVALAFAREGASVALCARTDAVLQQTAEEVRKCGVPVYAQAVDVRDPHQVSSVIENTRRRLGRIDILVQSAGGSFKIGPLSEVEDADWQNSYDLNVMSCIRFARAVIPEMQQRKWGRVVFISSIGGLQVTAAPGNRLVEYGTSKATLIALAKYASEHVAAENVLINCVCPGPIATPRSWGGMAAEVVRERIKIIPMGRLGTADEVADLVLFLSSERCTYITGTAIPIDGGNSRAIP
jgi:3-oxoacyl-[acyl-carrier protein] reductase